jgi:alpha-tubulin suppressor-like RCC1 family protein
MADFAYGFRQNTNYVITSNTMYEIGRNYRFSTSAPNQTAGSNNQWVAVSASQAGSSGGQSSLALQSNGTLWSWGNNSYGQLGNNSATNISSPIQVGALSLWSQISSGYYSTLAIQSNGTLWAWGSNAQGQLGLNTSTYYSSPVQVGALSNWATVLISSFSGLSIVSNGSLYAWGTNGFGQLGQNNTTNYSSPVQVVAANLVYTQIGVGLGTGYAIRDNGTLWAIGRGAFGNLGTGSTADVSSLVQVGSSSLWTSISGTRLGVLAIQTPGTLWAWGNDTSGALGLNTTVGTSYSTPIQVGALNVWTQVSGGSDYGLALRNNGTLWAWGSNGNGQLGLNTLTTPFSSPSQVGALTTWTRISAGHQHSGFIQSNGTLWMCGYNLAGQLGVNNSTARIYSPAQVGALTVWTRVSCGGPQGNNGFTMAIQSNGTLWSWGGNGFGQLGLNDTANRSSPVQVGALTVWTNIYCGYRNSVAVQSNGTLWSWGNNSFGQLGLNTTTTSYSSPVQVGILGNWALPTGISFDWTWASSSNQLYAWGDNAYGQLGQNATTVPRASSPLQIVPTTYLTATKIASSYYSNYAIQSPGTLWAWGRNDQGQLGQGNTTDRLGAVQIGALNYWTQISAGGVNGQVAAILSPGTLWAWGYNAQGQLGLNTTTSYSSPVQVGALSLWTQVACGYSHTAAIQTPGTLWAWGTNSYGQLGNNSAGPNVLSPIQIGTASNWSRVSCGFQYTIALQSNGTLWTWGLNSYSQLGYDTTSYRSSATQIGTVGAWTGFPAGSQNSFWGAAINSNNNLYVWGNNSNRILNSNYYITDTTDTVASCAIIANPVPLDTTLSSPIRSASIGDQFGAYVQSNGTLWSWGNLSYGQVPRTIGLVPNPVYMNGWTQIGSGRFNMYGLQSNGSLWAWGNNSFGQLGTNSTTLSDVSSPVPISGSDTWQQISTGNQSYFLAIQTNGTLWGAGINSSGQLGLSDTTNRSSPTRVGALSTWTQVSCGYTWSMALQTPGTLWTWGTNSYGQLGLNTTTNTSSPVQVSTILLRNWTQPNSDGYCSAAIQSPGTLWTWGTNSQGQLGLGDKASRSSPVQVGTLSTWTQVAFGTGAPWSFTMAIQTPGTLWAVGGTNARGQQGRNTSGASDISSPIQVGSTSTWVQVACGYQNTGAIQSNGTLWMCGYNIFGQLGIGNTASVSTFVQVGSLSNWASVSIGSSSNSMAIQSNGTLWTWGNNSFGQLGLNTISANILTPVQLGALSTWAQVSVGNRAWAAIQNNGTLWTCGYNRATGLNTDTNYSSPVQVGSLSYWTQVSVTNYQAASFCFMVALQSPGTLWTWGSNLFGQLGLNTNFNPKCPVQVGTSSNWTRAVAGMGSSVFIQSGLLWTCGYNNRGQLAQNNTLNYSSPVQVAASTGPVPLSTWTKISAGIFQSMAIQSPGTLWSWGSNSQGQLGLNTSTLSNVLNPVQVGALTTWNTVSALGYSTVGIQSNGTLWSWGNNSSGPLGSGTTTHRSSPVQVGALNIWDQVAGGVPGAGGNFTIARQNNGTLWSWGLNSFGQLGLNTLTNYSSPVQVGTLSTWSRFACGYAQTAAIQNNGTLWTWGYGTSGQLGNNSTINISSPVQIGALSIWTQVSCGILYTAAIQSPGTLWTWGDVASGQLGLNTSSSFSSPVQVGALNYWTQISCGGRWMAAILSPGTLWAWGLNAAGQLGISDTTNRSSPVQVGTLNYWTRIACGYNFMTALQSNGTLWMWGANNLGQLGQNDVTYRSSPVQVGTLSSWAQTSGGYNSAAAIQSNGVLWTWGSNSWGQLGNNSQTNRSSPLQIGELEVTWTQVSTRYLMTAAIQSPGTLWSWGLNNGGQLGLGDLTNRSSPAQVGTLSNWAFVSCGYFYNAATQSNGTLWVWGNNSYGQFGNNTINAGTSSPVQVGILSTWTRVFSGYFAVAGIDSSAKLYTWGITSYGQMGYSAVVAPIQISTQSNWSQVCCGPNYAIAVQSNGSLWAWGNNSYGQLGLNDLTHRSSITQIGLISNWSRVACGYTYTAALQSNGTLWSWGSNSFGQLGQGNFTNTSSPVQVGTLSRYVTVYAMNFTTLAETQ